MQQGYQKEQSLTAKQPMLVGLSFSILTALAASCSNKEVKFGGSSAKRTSEQPEANQVATSGPEDATPNNVSSIDPVKGDITGLVQLTSKTVSQDSTGGLAKSNFTVAAPYNDSYISLKLGLPNGIPGIPQLGGISILPTDENVMLIPASTNQAPLYEKIYQVKLKRDVNHRIIGFDGDASEYVTLPSSSLTNNTRNRVDAGNAFAPDGTLFTLGYPSGYLMQYAGTQLLNPSSVGFKTGFTGGAIAFVPAWHAKAGSAKIVSWNYYANNPSQMQKHSTFHDLKLSKSTAGYNLEIGPEIMNFRSVDIAEDNHAKRATNPEGIAFIPQGSNHFSKDSLVMAEWTEHKISVFEIDQDANPIPSTRKVLLSNSGDANNRMYPVGSFFDSTSGDLLFSTWPNEGRSGDIIIVRGFKGTVDETKTMANVKVFLDVNGNGSLDSDEPTTQTDASGNYKFSDLNSGDYKVVIQLPDGYTADAVSALAKVFTGDKPGSAKDINFTLKSK
jgi:hypothetical protein